MFLIFFSGLCSIKSGYRLHFNVKSVRASPGLVDNSQNWTGIKNMIGSINAAERKTKIIIDNDSAELSVHPRMEDEHYLIRRSCTGTDISANMIHLFTCFTCKNVPSASSLSHMSAQGATIFQFSISSQSLKLAVDHWSVSLSILNGSCSHRATHDRCLLLCSCRRGWVKVITRPWPSQRCFPLSWTPPNPTNIQTTTHWHTHTLSVGKEIQHIHKHTVHPCPLVNQSCESAIGNVATKASTWYAGICFVAYLCCSTVQSNCCLAGPVKSFLFSFSLLLLPIISSLPSISIQSSLVAYGFSALNCYFGKTLLK